MEKIVFVILLSAICISCVKQNDEYTDNPAWLNDEIARMDTVDYYYGTIVYLYEWNFSLYYLISIPLSSCAMCEFYNYNGVKQVWGADEFDDFQKNGKMIRTVWKRDNQISENQTHNKIYLVDYVFTFFC